MCKKFLENSQIRLNISQFLNKCIEDKIEKTHKKQLKSSFLHQIIIPGISASTLTFIYLQLGQKLQKLVKKTEGILGVNGGPF